MKCKWSAGAVICVGFIFLFVFLGKIPVTAAPSDAVKVVRVGYLENYGVITNAKDAEKRGYGYDYLAEIAKYTGWKYEYIPCSWSEGLEKLRSGEIDIFGPMQKTPEREALFDFPFREMGFEYGAIYVPEKKKFFYNDTASINGLRVGSEKDNFYKQRLNEYCKKNNIQVTYVDATVDSFQSGLESGLYDAVCVGSILDLPDTSVAAKISSDPYYFVTTKGNLGVLEGLNAGLAQILTEDAYFAADLDRKYYSDKPINLPFFTREEDTFIQTHPKLRVVGDPHWSPIEYIDDKSGAYKGITIDIFRELQKDTGIVFEFIKTDSYAQSMAMIKEGKADLLVGYTEYAQDLGLSYSKNFLEVPILLVGRKMGHTQNSENLLRAAIPSVDTATAKQIIRKYPNFTYEKYPDMKSTLESLQMNHERYTFINAYEFGEVVRDEPLDEFTSVATDIEVPLNIGVAPTVDPIVVDILNKAIDRLRPEQISTIVFANTLNRTQAVPMTRVIREHALSVGGALVGVFCLLIVLIQYNNRRVKRKLEKIAYIDDITGLLTAVKFKLDAQALLRQGKPFQYTIVSVDIDNFKYINDSFGYATGNLILNSVAKSLRKYIGPDERIGRANADQFIMLVKTQSWEELRKKYEEMTMIEHSRAASLSENYRIIFSAGAYVINGTEDIHNALDKANIARKSQKNIYMNTITEYTEAMNEQLEWKKQVTLDMEQALSNGEFTVYLQPKLYFHNETIVGAEALVRWNHPKRGLVAPGLFIPIFEKNGFIQKLDLYVFEQVCALIKKWERTHLFVLPIALSVNLSRLHLSNRNLVEELVGLTKTYDIRPDQLEIELTESMLFGSAEVIADFMRKLKDVGFRISIDDFGSGYSSLSLLKDLPADVLKIDKGFLDESADTKKGRLILSSIIDISKNLNMATVAEGVETKEQAQFLRAIGCDIAQGYYYAKPMPIDAFEAFVVSKLERPESETRKI